MATGSEAHPLLDRIDQPGRFGWRQEADLDQVGARSRRPIAASSDGT